LRHQVIVGWDAVRRELPTVATDALNRFRRRTRQPTILAENLGWVLAWDEDFVPLDVNSSTAEERAARRELAVTHVDVTCGDGAHEASVPFREGVPGIVLDAMVTQERCRGSE